MSWMGNNAILNHRLVLRGASVSSALQLLPRHENGLTFAFGYALQRAPRLLTELLAEVGVSRRVASSPCEIRLQERGTEGITDLEIESIDGRFLVTTEAKIGSWPEADQLARYARQMKKVQVRQKILVALGVPPSPPEFPGRRGCEPGISLRLIRWTEILQMVNKVKALMRDNGAGVLEDFSTLIEEVIGMQSYDREVLIRDMDVQGRSLAVYLDGNLYACQPNERAEPLFFAPCFTNGVSDSQNGIHYFSRVYCRVTARLGRVAEVRDAMTKATEVIEVKIRGMSHRKTGREDIAYLKGLPSKWSSGLRTVRRHWPRGGTALFFLGDPIRVPNPVKKQGKMVPLGFSMSLERLLTLGRASFGC